MHDLRVSRLWWIVGALVVLASCTEGDARPVPTGEHVHGANGFSLMAPRGWTAIRTSGGLTVYGGDQFIHETCDSKWDFTHVGVDVSLVSTPTAVTFDERPATFTPASGSGLRRGHANPCGSRRQQISFTDRGKRVRVEVVIGSKASKRDRATGYR